MNPHSLFPPKTRAEETRDALLLAVADLLKRDTLGAESVKDVLGSIFLWSNGTEFLKQFDGDEIDLREKLEKFRSSLNNEEGGKPHLQRGETAPKVAEILDESGGEPPLWCSGLSLDAKKNTLAAYHVLPDNDPVALAISHWESMPVDLRAWVRFCYNKRIETWLCQLDEGDWISLNLNARNVNPRAPTLDELTQRRESYHANGRILHRIEIDWEVTGSVFHFDRDGTSKIRLPNIQQETAQKYWGHLHKLLNIALNPFYSDADGFLIAEKNETTMRLWIDNGLLTLSDRDATVSNGNPLYGYWLLLGHETSAEYFSIDFKNS